MKHGLAIGVFVVLSILSMSRPVAATECNESCEAIYDENMEQIGIACAVYFNSNTGQRNCRIWQGTYGGWICMTDSCSTALLTDGTGGILAFAKSCDPDSKTEDAAEPQGFSGWVTRLLRFVDHVHGSVGSALAGSSSRPA